MLPFTSILTRCILADVVQQDAGDSPLPVCLAANQHWSRRIATDYTGMESRSRIGVCRCDQNPPACGIIQQMSARAANLALGAEDITSK